MYKVLLVLAFSFFFSSLKSQEFLGIRQSNYSGIMGLDFNPSSLADNRMKVDVLLFGAHLSAYNNHAYWLNNGGLERFVTIDSVNNYTNAQFYENNSGLKARSAFIQTEIDVLNFMVSINHKRSIGFQIKNRTFLNIDNVSPELIRLASNEWNYMQLFNLNLKDQEMNLSMNTWNEYNFAYAQILKEDNQHFWKMGAKLKFLQGIGSFYLYTDNVDFNIQNDTTANFIKGDFDYGYSDNLGGYIEPKDNSNEEFSPAEMFKKYSNLGLGFDVGITYEYRPDYKKFKYDMDDKTDLWRKDQNKYKLRIGAAINDIGGMRYKKGSLSRNFSFQTGVFDLQQFDGVEGFRSLDSALIKLETQGDVAFRSDDGEFFMNLPTHANIDVDYNIWKNIYANYYMRLNLLFMKDQNAVHYPNNFAITPRWEKRWFGVSIPLSYNNVTGFRYGLGLRAGPIVIGTGDLNPLLALNSSTTKVNGGDFYFAIKIPILNPKPKDRDKDKVSDKKDICKDVYGVWAFRGCPDTDKDGIQDSEDDCPLDSGLVQFKGCPDTDGDGIINKLDSCVTDSGMIEFNGCPDIDKDGIMDKEDDCPTQAGLVEFKGCPDTDKDGIKNAEDKCPTFPGPISNKGCPLRLLHVLDSLNEIVYTDTLLFDEEKFKFNQLPTDKGYLFELINADDSCPEYIEIDILDNDTIKTIRVNKTDSTKCIYASVVKGQEVILTQEEQEVLNTAFNNLEFETGKVIIKESSLPSLAELALLLKKKPTWALKIEGHTDNVGKAANNLKLSKLRAEAVKEYLIQKGTDGNRFEVKWFGHAKPVDSNKTAEGRQKNRRVEMIVIQN